FFIGGVGWGAMAFPVAGGAPSPPLPAGATLLLGAGAGLLGALLDSWLGARFQAMYRCPHCGQETEQQQHRPCGVSTRLVRGVPWLNNDGVNFLASLAGAVVALVIGGLWQKIFGGGASLLTFF
ncbi:MAG: DUF92 domain-containing protein, partial [Caldilineae bacterium]